MGSAEGYACLIYGALVRETYEEIEQSHEDWDGILYRLGLDYALQGPAHAQSSNNVVIGIRSPFRSDTCARPCRVHELDNSLGFKHGELIKEALRVLGLTELDRGWWLTVTCDS